MPITFIFNFYISIFRLSLKAPLISKRSAELSGTLSPIEQLRKYSRHDASMWPNRLLDDRRTVMGIIMWLIVGGVIGWLASVIMRTDGQQGIVMNIVVGVVGAFIGGLILARGDINNAPLTITTFLVSLAGAVVLLAIVNLVRRGSIR